MSKASRAIHAYILLLTSSEVFLAANRRKQSTIISMFKRLSRFPMFSRQSDRRESLQIEESRLKKSRETTLVGREERFHPTPKRIYSLPNNKRKLRSIIAANDRSFFSWLLLVREKTVSPLFQSSSKRKWAQNVNRDTHWSLSDLLMGHVWEQTNIFLFWVRHDPLTVCVYDLDFRKDCPGQSPIIRTDDGFWGTFANCKHLPSPRLTLSVSVARRKGRNSSNIGTNRGIAEI